MGILDQLHPFRQSIGHDGMTMPPPSESSQQNNQGGEFGTGSNSGGVSGGGSQDDSAHALAMFKLKLRIAGVVAAIAILIYVYFWVYNLVHSAPGQHKMSRTTNNVKVFQDEGSYYSNPYEQKKPEKAAWRSIGILDRLFCGRGRRALACE